MANTYTQLYVQVVFAPEGRLNLIKKEFQEDLHKYITGIVTNNKCKMLAINSMPDHIHIFFGLNPNISLSDLVKDMKQFSSKRINEQGFCGGKFSRQSGYGAFSYSYEQIDVVYKYVMNQQEHHKIGNFKDEYLKLLKDFEITFEEKYIFSFE